MNEYSIHVESGKVIGDSAFFLIANDLLGKECKRLCDFTDSLDKAPLQKKEKIAEYKCAKYRYAGATNVWCRFFHSHRVAGRNVGTHYLIPQLNDIFIKTPEYVALYDNAPDGEKQDYALYYGTIAFTDSEIAKLEATFENATDWQKIEIEERIGGLNFAKECLNKAWQRRKEVIE